VLRRTPGPDIPQANHARVASPKLSPSDSSATVGTASARHDRIASTMCLQRLLPACRNALAPEREHDRFGQRTPVSHWKGLLTGRERQRQRLGDFAVELMGAVHELETQTLAWTASPRSCGR
jgi:hypothetical protein